MNFFLPDLNTENTLAEHMELSEDKMEELLSRDLTKEEEETLPTGLLQFWAELLRARIKEEEERIEASIGVVPPFYRKIQDFFVTAIIISYLGYRDEIANLMHRLSRSTRRYFKREMKESLKEVL